MGWMGRRLEGWWGQGRVRWGRGGLVIGWGGVGYGEVLGGVLGRVLGGVLGGALGRVLGRKVVVEEEGGDVGRSG